MKVCFDIYVLNIFIFDMYETFNIILVDICKTYVYILLNIYFCSCSFEFICCPVP